MFTFVLGRGNTEFEVHSHMIGVQSKVLHAIMNSQLSETIAGRAELMDVSATAHYTILTPCVRDVVSGEVVARRRKGKTQTERSVENVVEETRERERREAKAKKKQKKGIVDTVTQRRADLASLLWRNEDDSVDWIMPCTVLTNNDASQDYTPIFLDHAKLYVFADIWGADNAKQSMFIRLQTTLQNFTFVL